jgi:hypothetical protein
VCAFVLEREKEKEKEREERCVCVCVFLCVCMYRFDDIDITYRKCRGMNDMVAQRHTGDRTGSEQGTPPAQTA